MKKIAIIPARYASSRFPGKPLALLKDKPMVMWVYDAVKASGLFDKVVVATDDERIVAAVVSLGGEAMMTSSLLSCGTKRCEAVDAEGSVGVVSLQTQPAYPAVHLHAGYGEVESVTDGA